MPVYRPKSIVSLILVGFGVVLAPFVIAVAVAVIQVDRFASASRTAVLNAGSATEDSRTLVEQVTEMQRALGQYVVLGEREYLDRYLELRSDYRAALANLIALNLDGIDAERLRSLAEDEASSFRRIQEGSVPDGDWEAAIDGLDSLAARSRVVLAESDRLVQENANDLNARAESLQTTLLVIAAAAAPATVLLAVIFTFLITRPMLKLGQEIRRLGARSLEQPVVVEGPQDIESIAGELEWLRRRINALEEQKATFLQHISHELKTPLATIREGSDLLTESLGQERSEDAEIARLLQRNGLYLQRLIEDLLQFAKTQDLAIDLEFEPAVDLGLLIGHVLDSLSIVAEAKDIEFEVSLAPVLARCDADKVRTIIDNLLTNAIKYTPERGHIEIRLESEAGEAWIDVHDSGPGVAKAERSKIFEPFKQGSAEYESSVKGTGLGLSIAREYVEAHGGTIRLLESRSGAHFRVVLPLAGPQPD